MKRPIMKINITINNYKDCNFVNKNEPVNKKKVIETLFSIAMYIAKLIGLIIVVWPDLG